MQNYYQALKKANLWINSATFDQQTKSEIKDIIAPIIPMNIHKKEEWDIDLSIGNIIQAHKVLIKYIAKKKSKKKLIRNT